MQQPTAKQRGPRTTAEDYEALANRRGLRWLGAVAVRVKDNTWWRCKRGHEFESSYDAIRASKRSGCRECMLIDAANRLRFGPEYYQALAKSRGYSWLGPEVAKTGLKTRWRCEHGHEWEANANSIQRGCGCPKCASQHRNNGRRLTPQNYREMAAKSALVWLGPEVRTNSLKTHWQCAQGHTFEANYSNVQSGCGCPICADMVNGALVSRPQRALCEMLNGVLNYKVGRYRLDIAILTTGACIDVEYDCAYWHQPERDARRDAYLQARGWRILRVKSRTLLPTRSEIDLLLIRLVAGSQYEEIILDDWLF